jgi:hypothetical protein
MAAAGTRILIQAGQIDGLGYVAVRTQSSITF